MNKKLHLLLVFGLLCLGNLSAQTTISFETSEGYVLGDINGQNGWTVTGAGQGGFISNQVVSATLASQGTQSLKIDEDSAYGTQQNLIMGAFYELNTPLNSTHYSVSADINFSYGANDESAFMMGITGDTSFLARFIFEYDASIIVTTVNAGNPAGYELPNKTWTGGQWYNVKIEVDGTSVKYYIDNNLEYTGVVTGNENEQLEGMRFTHDNYGGGAYIDNIVITDLNSSGAKDFEAFGYNVYPNPFTDEMNVSLGDKVIQGIHLTDLNGRIVKTFNVSGMNNATLNVSDLASGVYLLSVKADGVTATKKVVKK